MSKLREKLAHLKPMVKKAGILDELESIGSQKIGYAIKDVLIMHVDPYTISEFASTSNVTLNADLLNDGMAADIMRLNFAVELFIHDELAEEVFNALKDFYGITEEFSPDAKNAINNYAKKLDQIANIDQLDFKEEFNEAYGLMTE